MQTTQDKWLSSRRAKRLWLVSKAIIYRSIQRDELAHIRLSARTIRIPRTALETEAKQ